MHRYICHISRFLHLWTIPIASFYFICFESNSSSSKLKFDVCRRAKQQLTRWTATLQSSPAKSPKFPLKSMPPILSLRWLFFDHVDFDLFLEKEQKQTVPDFWTLLPLWFLSILSSGERSTVGVPTGEFAHFIHVLTFNNQPMDIEQCNNFEPNAPLYHIVSKRYVNLKIETALVLLQT